MSVWCKIGFSQTLVLSIVVSVQSLGIQHLPHLFEIAICLLVSTPSSSVITNHRFAQQHCCLQKAKDI